MVSDLCAIVFTTSSDIRYFKIFQIIDTQQERTINWPSSSEGCPLGIQLEKCNWTAETGHSTCYLPTTEKLEENSQYQTDGPNMHLFFKLDKVPLGQLANRPLWFAQTDSWLTKLRNKYGNGTSSR